MVLYVKRAICSFAREIMKISKFCKCLFALFCVPIFVGVIHGQVFTKNYRGFIGEDAVIVSLTYDRLTGKINGSYTKLKDNVKQNLQGNFYKESKPIKPTPTPTQPIVKVTVTNTYTIYEINPKNKKVLGKATLNLGDNIEGTWITPKNIWKDLSLKTDFDAKPETYKIHGKQFSEISEKFEILTFSPNISSENQEVEKAFNEFIKQKMQAAYLSFRQESNENYEDEYKLWKIKFFLRSNFHTVFANDRFISANIFFSEANGTKTQKDFWETNEISINFDLKTKQEISIESLFEPETDYLKIFSEACKERFKGMRRKIDYRPIYEDVPLNFCEAKPDNFNSWLITKDGLYFKINPTNGISNTYMPLSFSKIESLGGRFRQDGAIYNLAFNKKL
jgi:hypothetical protein